jgi:glyoxylase-like metal-dependent hydrolase (beta-lactamase superfamily II)
MLIDPRPALVALALILAGCAQASDPAVTSSMPVAAPSAEEGVHRFKIGRLDATVVQDGQLTAPVGQVWKDPSAAEIGRVLAAAGLPTDQVNLSLQALLVRAGDRLFLIDTGMGPSPTAGRLVANLAKTGVTPDQITDIVITHSHADHIGGLLADGRSVFPNARVRMTSAEWAAVSGDARNATRVAAIRPQLATFEPGAVLAPGVRAVEVRGHTPGHTAVEIENGGQRLLAIGDTAHHYVVSLRQPEYTIGFDDKPEIAEASRRTLLGRAADGRIRVFAPHFPYPGLGTVRREGDGFAWTPAP